MCGEAQMAFQKKAATINYMVVRVVFRGQFGGICSFAMLSGYDRFC